jgi:hypothetical protein
MWAGPKEVLQKESGRRLSYIYISIVHAWRFFQQLVAPLVLKIGIQQGERE